MEQFNTIPTSGNWADIAGILDANFLRCWTALVQSESLIGLDGSNYRGIFTSADALPEMTEPGWALVGTSLSALKLYVYNEGSTDWALLNDTTYDFTNFTEFQNQLDALSSQVATIGLKIGELANLTTTDKSSVVGAVNELNDEIGVVEQSMGSLIFDELDFSSVSQIPYYPTTQYGWGQYSTYKSKIVEIPTGAKYISVTAPSSDVANIALLASGTAPSAKNAPIDYASGENSVHVIAAGETSTLSLPDDCTHFGVRTYTTKDVTPTVRYGAASIDGIVGELENISDRVATIEDEMVGCQLETDTSHLVNAYPSKTVSSSVVFTASTASVSYDKIIRVAKGVQYTVKVTNSSTPASATGRNPVIVSEDYVVRQVLTMYTTAGETDTMTFTAEADGYLILCVDLNHISVEIFGDEIRTDIYENVAKIAQLGKGYLYRYNASVARNSTFNDPYHYTFKANHTYVVVVESTQGWKDVRMGISGIGEKILRFDADGLDVVKFDVGDSDISGNIYITNNSTTAYTYTYIVEEWTERDRWRMSEPATIRVAACQSSARDKYLSRYICDWENDEVEIQAAIDGLPSIGGKVKLCDGEYLISEVKDSGNSELGYLGLELTHPDVRHYIEISGDSKPIRVSDKETKIGATIYLATDAVSEFDTSTHITLIGALPTDSSLQRLARGINFSFKNIGINIPGNSKAIRCIDAEYCSALEIENVSIGLIDSSTMSTTPNMDCIGIRGLGGWNYGIYYTMRCVKVFGVGIAFDLGGEHLLMEQCAARHCDTPYRFYYYGDVTKMSHPNTMINCCEEHTKRGIVFGANSRHPGISIIDYNIEWRPSENSGVWGRSTGAVEDNPGDIKGFCNFVANKENYINIPDFKFWESGSGINIQTRNDCDLLSGTTAQRPLYPTMLQRYYDTTLGRVVYYNGSEWV